MYDIIVVGAGPAGLTAALYARRQNKTVLVLEKNTFGGQTVFSPKIENYPGFLEMSGMEFSDKLVEQVLAQGAELEMEGAISIRVTEEGFAVVTEYGEHEAKAVILACGARHRMLGLDGEEDYVGSGISFCAVCDGAFYKDKTVAVIGGGNSALQEALLLSETCKQVHVVQNLAKLTGEEQLVKALEAKDNVDVTYNTVVTGLEGDGELSAILLKNEQDGTTSRMELDGMFVAIGLIPDNDVAKGVIPMDAYGYIPADESCLTTTPGIFVAGDCRTKKIRQIATAIADGATAALAACKFVESK